ncbi:MAG TPA: hypothetical protein VKV15_00265 [Bryobacteraceae bacterium]|nr:hypothetical protein [Bryobacteraceae bacterium]
MIFSKTVRTYALWPIAAALLLASFCIVFVRHAGGQSAPPSAASRHNSPSEGLQAVNLLFGVKDAKPTAWDGSATISAGAIERIEGYHFTDSAKARTTEATSVEWVCSSHEWTPYASGMHPNERPEPHATMLVPIGVTIYYRAPADAKLQVKLKTGDEFSFRLAELPEIDAIYPLNNHAIEVRRSAVVQKITDAEYEDDYPSIATDGDTVWVAWQAFKNKGDQIFLRSYRNGQWGPRLAVTETPGDLFGTGVAAANGKVMVVWSEHEGDNFQLRARPYDGSAFGTIETLTTGEGRNLFHQLSGDPQGNVHVAYQSWRKGRSDIYLRSYVAGHWQPELDLSDRSRSVRANDWDPAVTVDHNGNAWVAWDGYATGSFNVYLREVSNGRPGTLLAVTGSNRYHAHPSLAVDKQNRLWIAYEQAPENWGKDVGFLFEGGSALYDARDVKLAIYAGGRWLAPLRQPSEVAPPVMRDFLQQPRLVTDAGGRIWLLMHPMTATRLPTTHWKAGGKWETCATYYSGDRWSPFIMFPESTGRNGGPVEAAPDSAGNVNVVFVTDNKIWGGPNFGYPPGNNDIVFSRVRTQSPFAPGVAARGSESPAGLPNEPHEKEQIARLRDYTIQAEGKTYRIYRGDIHRHTEISLDGAGDGTLWDSYRYALDAANLDFLGVTDHQSGDSEYTWWRIQKSADMFNVPGFFTALFATERSVNYPNGHRNLLFPERGVPILDISPEERTAKINSGSVLFPFLKKYGGISTPHSPHTVMGTDWRDNDPAVDTIVEIWEGSRTSAEHEGAPLAPSADKSQLWAGGYKPLGFVWNAWAKGYKIGVQASSDHASTHLSYTCVIAENPTRKGLIEAMRHRHTYAATRNILLDYRMRAGGKTYLQGDELESSSLPEIYAKIHGAGPLKRVVIVRDNQYIYTQDPQGETFELHYRENSLTPGEHYYYVRLEQQDENMAWSSPIWINYKGAAR